MRKLVGGVLGCLGLWFVACGGKLIDGSHGAAGELSAGAAGAGTPGAGASSGGSSAGSELFDPPDADPPCVDVGDNVPCAKSCGSDTLNAVPGECVRGEWRCPATWVDPNTCPADSCIRQGHTCCDHRFGKRSSPPCTASGLIGECPAGLERDVALCVADSAHTTNCGSLIGQSCTLENALCEANGAHCLCATSNGDAGLTWSCVFDLL